MMKQLRDLSKPFASSLVQPPPKGKYGDYVSHSTVTERALSILGAYSIENVQLIYDEGMVTGALVTIVCEVDGRTARITEAGDVENPVAKKTNGARAKDAISDAVKRCWMRLGLGLHLWSQDDYFLHNLLTRDHPDAPKPPSEAADEPRPSNSPPEPAKGVNTGAQPEDERLRPDRALSMAGQLAGIGFNEHKTLMIADRVTGRKVQALTDLSVTEAAKVWSEAKRLHKMAGPPFDPDPPEKTKDFEPNPKPRTLNNNESSQLHKALGTWGVKDHMVFVELTIGRVVESFTELTVVQSIRVYEHALELHGDERQKEEYAARRAA